MFHISKPKLPSIGHRHKGGNPGTKTLPSATPNPSPATTPKPAEASSPKVEQSKSPASLPSPQPKIEAVPTEKKVNKKTW